MELFNAIESTHRNNGPSLEQCENAWNAIRTGEQVQKVSGYLGLLPGLLERTTRTALRNGHFNLTTLVKRPTDSRES